MIDKERPLAIKGISVRNADNDEAYQIVMAASKIPTHEVICQLTDSSTGQPLAKITRVPSLDVENEMFDGIADLIAAISDHGSEVNTVTTVKRRRVTTPISPSQVRE